MSQRPRADGARQRQHGHGREIGTVVVGIEEWSCRSIDGRPVDQVFTANQAAEEPFCSDGLGEPGRGGQHRRDQRGSKDRVRRPAAENETRGHERQDSRQHLRERRGDGIGPRFGRRPVQDLRAEVRHEVEQEGTREDDRQRWRSQARPLDRQAQDGTKQDGAEYGDVQARSRNDQRPRKRRHERQGDEARQRRDESSRQDDDGAHHGGHA